MTREDVIGVVAKALVEDASVITSDTSTETHPAWDSFAQVDILVGLGVASGDQTAQIDELAAATSVQQIVEVLAKHGIIE